MSLMRAGANALATGQALFRKERHHGSGVDALRVMAPDAAQRATLQENCSADAGPVMNRKTLDIENAPQRSC